ncbi:hypothetical protein NXS98_01570 [Fontisphaera persica]|uniref:hypothetical protein n=1 Tax=Fontisphaera persica TaxID=2974023 RepID=UPI0024BFC13F|nr:hypothetical protein [Fontisphaera persica]WCJ59835.1 hypothetical protein NXS98_01570 [Fontisphaera persica]
MHGWLRIVAYGGLIASAVLFGLAAATARESMGTNGALCFFSIVALALLVARDFSRFFADRAVDFMYNDDGEGQKDQEYEQAEAVWRQGDYLEAIRLFRAYLEKHPREIHVALRIAEIYETNLGNYLAAALEYEEVLKKPIHPERWGLRAIHLCNLYHKLNQPAKATALLERIATEYSQTAAAKKAREKLGWPEPQPTPETPAEPAPEEPAPQPEEPKGPALPPGFRPKK